MVFTWGRILGRNPDKSLKSFPLSYSRSLPQLCLQIYISSNSFKLFQYLQFLLHTVKEEGGKPDRKPHPLPYALRNPYSNLKSRNSQDYAQKSQRNCAFMNSASALSWWYIPFCHFAEMSGSKVLVPLYQVEILVCQYYSSVWIYGISLIHKYWISIHFSVLFMYHIPALYTAYTICHIPALYICHIPALYICPIPAL